MDYPAVFVATLFHSGTNAHFMHLQTDSYAKHVAPPSVLRSTTNPIAKQRKNHEQSKYQIRHQTS